MQTKKLYIYYSRRNWQGYINNRSKRKIQRLLRIYKSLDFRSTMRDVLIDIL